VLPLGLARIDKESHVIAAFDKIRQLENKADDSAIIAQLACKPTRRAFYAKLCLQYQAEAEAVR